MKSVAVFCSSSLTFISQAPFREREREREGGGRSGEKGKEERERERKREGTDRV